MDRAVARLVALGTPGVPGSDLELTRDHMTLSRSHSNDLVLAEPAVSRVPDSGARESAGRRLRPPCLSRPRRSHGRTGRCKDPGCRAVRIENQRAGNIGNVAGNQYTAYVSHVRKERESFLQAVAATKTKARWLIWIGVV